MMEIFAIFFFLFFVIKIIFKLNFNLKFEIFQTMDPSSDDFAYFFPYPLHSIADASFRKFTV